MGLDRDERRIRSDSERFWSRWSYTSHGRCSASWMAELHKDPLLRTARVVCDLSMARETQRVLLGPAFAVAGAGRSSSARAVHGEVVEDPSLSEGLEPGQGGPVQRTVAFSMSGRLVKPVDILATGWPLGGRGEVSLLADGMDWDERQVWLRGPISGGVRFGRNEELVHLSVSDPPIKGAQIPAWILDRTRWPRLPDSSVGQRVPIIVGKGTLPCPRVDNSTDGAGDDFLVGYGHRLNVTAKAIDGVSTVGGSVVETEDDRGLPVTILRFTAIMGATDEFTEVHATVQQDDADLDGLTLPVAIRQVLNRYGGFERDRLSDRLFAETGARLAQYGPAAGGDPIRLAINQPAYALDWIGNQILREHPYLSMVWDGPGIGPVAIDHRATPVMSLSQRTYPVIDRTKGSQYEQQPLADLRTSFALRWSYSPITEAWSQVSLRESRTNGLCEMATRVLEGDQPEPEIEALSVLDESTANYILDWLCEHRCRPSFTVQLDCYPVAWFALRLGDKVLWTDSDMGWEEEAALVVGRSWARGLVRLTLRVYPDLWKLGGGARGFTG